MESKELNIVDLIENNPITKLSSDYNVKLLQKIKEQFTDFEQQLFLSSFYCYLNHHPTNDFVIDLDSVWKWMGFQSKYNAKRVLERNFTIEKDYKNPLRSPAKQTIHTKGGHNKEIFMLNVKTFKSLCLKADTKKADEIHDYFLKMEHIIQESINEESNDLRNQLTIKTIQLTEQTIQLENVEKDKELLKEKTIIDQFPLNTQCIYIGKIDNKTLGIPGHKMYHETVIKFGQSNNLAERVKCHKKTYENFRLYAAFKVKNKIEIENAIKKHPILKTRLRLITLIDDITYRELLALNEEEFTIEKMEEYIKEIIKQNEYNVENYNLLLQKNALLEEENYAFKLANNEKDKKINELSQKLENYSDTNMNDITIVSKNKISNKYGICKFGYFLYVFQYENMRFICSITRQKDFDSICSTLLNLYPSGSMIYKQIVNASFSEKNMYFLLKRTMTLLGSNKFEGTFENVKTIIDITVSLEKLLTEKSTDLPQLLTIMKNEPINNVPVIVNYVDPETPQVKKAKRSIDQINKETGAIIKTYESIEAAGRSLGLTTGTAIGIALREKRVCQGFIWRYTGVSREEQYNEQPVIKVCCSTGNKTYFKTITDAAKDVNISSPALRQRIITQVHLLDHHWIFNKDIKPTHYS
uniref:MSV199 domain-containing protein n=1 Tax=viral metagenome TaxID=1070528 RepID=A0A6C0HGN2_9ZZZZ